MRNQDLGRCEATHQSVDGMVDLNVHATALGLSVRDGVVDQASISGLVGCSQDQRGVGGGILNKSQYIEYYQVLVSFMILPEVYRRRWLEIDGSDSVVIRIAIVRTYTQSLPSRKQQRFQFV